jgi:hypothetical protein
LKKKYQKLLFIWAETGRPKSKTGELLLLDHGGGGRPILMVTGDKVGRGGVRGLHDVVGK